MMMTALESSHALSRRLFYVSKHKSDLWNLCRQAVLPCVEPCEHDPSKYLYRLIVDGMRANIYACDKYAGNSSDYVEQ